MEKMVMAYRAKSIAVKAVSAMITLYPHVAMGNLYVFLFVAYGSKEKCNCTVSGIKKKNFSPQSKQPILIAFHNKTKEKLKHTD